RRRHRSRQGSRADGALRSAPHAVHGSANAADLPAARRPRARGVGRPKRGAHSESAARVESVRPARAGAALVLYAARSRCVHLVDPLAGVVHALDANMPISDVRTYADVYRYNVVEGPGTGVEIVATMGAVGLMLAVAGLYGLVAYSVSRRTREIGVRIAIGASPSDVLRLVMGKGVVLVGTGATIGIVLGLGLERLLNAFLFNAGGVDLLAYAIVVPSLLTVTMIATYVPARRAARIAPTQALRYE